MTDDQLETLLRDTFRSREPLADPARAEAIARTVRPTGRRWPAYVAVAAAVVGIALVGALLVGDRTTEPPVTRPSPPPPASTATYQDNRAIALAEAQRLVRLVPLPDGAVETDGAPWGDHVGMAPSDPGLRQTMVWEVPMDADSVAAHLRSHTLDGASGTDGGSSQSMGGPVVQELDYTVPTDAPAAMMDTTVAVQWVPDGDRTLVRADAFTAARSVRTAATYVGGDVTAVDIERVVPRSPRPQRLPTVHLTAPDDATDIAALVDAVNAIHGSIRPDQVVSCPGMSEPLPMNTLTFHTADGETTYHWLDWCLGQVEVRRDGVLLRPTLDPGDLGEAVESAVGPR